MHTALFTVTVMDDVQRGLRATEHAVLLWSGVRCVYVILAEDACYLDHICPLSIPYADHLARVMSRQKCHPLDSER